jgi:hypothetical protein
LKGAVYNANMEDGDCEPHRSAQQEMDEASKAAIEAADFLSASPSDARAVAREEIVAAMTKYFQSTINCNFPHYGTETSRRRTSTRLGDTMNPSAVAVGYNEEPRALDPASSSVPEGSSLKWMG